MTQISKFPEFSRIFIDTGNKYEYKEEVDTKENALYICGCGKSFPGLFELVLHESNTHVIEFSRITTKLKCLIDEFNLPKENYVKEPKVESEEEQEDYTENIEEDAIIQRLQELGCLKVKTKEEISHKSKNEKYLKMKPKKHVETVSVRKIASRSKKPHFTSFTCQHCPSTFDKNSSLKEHERTHKFICDYCGCSYTVKTNLKMHIFREHKGVKTYCTECGVQTINLTEHMKKHERDPTMVCDVCGKEMRGKQRMNNHMNRAHKSRFARFFCQYCNQGFRYMTDLKEHSIKHEPDRKDHVCPECGKAFRRRNEMLRHWRSHDGKKWQCLDCGREYAWQRGLWTHKNKGYCKVPANK